MSERNNSIQMTLNVFGFVFVVLGLGLEGRMAFILLGAAIALFVAALAMAAFRADDNGADGH